MNQNVQLFIRSTMVFLSVAVFKYPLHEFRETKYAQFYYSYRMIYHKHFISMTQRLLYLFIYYDVSQ